MTTPGRRERVTGGARPGAGVAVVVGRYLHRACPGCSAAPRGEPALVHEGSRQSGLWSSRGLGVVCPGDALVVELVVQQAAVEDADEPVAECPQGLVVGVAAGAVLVVVAARAGGVGERTGRELRTAGGKRRSFGSSAGSIPSAWVWCSKEAAQYPWRWSAPGLDRRHRVELRADLAHRLPQALPPAGWWIVRRSSGWQDPVEMSPRVILPSQDRDG